MRRLRARALSGNREPRTGQHRIDEQQPPRVLPGEVRRCRRVGAINGVVPQQATESVGLHVDAPHVVEAERDRRLRGEGGTEPGLRQAKALEQPAEDLQAKVKPDGPGLPREHRRCLFLVHIHRLQNERRFLREDVPQVPHRPGPPLTGSHHLRRPERRTRNPHDVGAERRPQILHDRIAVTQGDESHTSTGLISHPRTAAPAIRTDPDPRAPPLRIMGNRSPPRQRPRYRGDACCLP
jgi:hypothetical protein